MTEFSEKDILHQLDSCNEKFEFPSLENLNIDYVSGRLMGFRDEKRWALIFNSIVWVPSANGPHAMIECFGNCIKGILGFDDNRLFSPARFEFSEPDEVGDAKVTSVEIRGQKLHPEDIQEDSDAQIHQETGFRVLVWLTYRFRESLFASPEEYMKFIPNDLPKIIVLEEWFHNNLGQSPSQTETFQLLAKVLVSGDPNHYKPTLKPNTHWKNWIPK